jgi:hypothetical protein
MPPGPSPRGVEPAVVVPLAAARRLAPMPASGTLRPARAGSAIVARLADYRPGLPPDERSRARTAPPAPRRPRAPRLPASVQTHLDELESLLRDHIDTQLELLDGAAPECRQALDTVRRSVDLLLRLRAR